jgi:hypothetical protein
MVIYSVFCAKQIIAHQIKRIFLDYGQMFILNINPKFNAHLPNLYIYALCLPNSFKLFTNSLNYFCFSVGSVFSDFTPLFTLLFTPTPCCSASSRVGNAENVDF